MSNINTLSDRAMLVTLSITGWTATKLDRAATRKTTDDAGAVSDAARVNKHLLAGQDESLKRVNAIVSAARAENYRLTLPWNDSGARIVTAALWPALNTALQSFALDYKPAVDAFLTDYALARDAARFKLGSLFNEKDFPPVPRVAEKFSFSFDYDAIPTDFRVKMADDDADAIRKDIETRAAARFNNAMRELWTRLFDTVQHISTTLPAFEDGKTKRFNDSLITNLRDLLNILPGLNITQDATLAAIADRAQAELAGIDPQTLRDSPATRQRATSAAASICGIMAQHMGLPAPAPVPTVPEVIKQAEARVYSLFSAPVRAA